MNISITKVHPKEVDMVTIQETVVGLGPRIRSLLTLGAFPVRNDERKVLRSYTVPGKISTQLVEFVPRWISDNLSFDEAFNNNTKLETLKGLDRNGDFYEFFGIIICGKNNDVTNSTPTYLASVDNVKQYDVNDIPDGYFRLDSLLMKSSEELHQQGIKCGKVTNEWNHSIGDLYYCVKLDTENFQYVVSAHMNTNTIETVSLTKKGPVRMKNLDTQEFTENGWRNIIELEIPTCEILGNISGCFHETEKIS